MATLGQIFTGLITKPRIEREAAALVDLIFSLTLATLPGIAGSVAGVAYFLLRDGRANGMGKRLYGLETVRAADGRRASWSTAMLRNMLLLVPLFNLVDVWHFFKSGRRLTDEWLGTDVRKGGPLPSDAPVADGVEAEAEEQTG